MSIAERAPEQVASTVMHFENAPFTTVTNYLDEPMIEAPDALMLALEKGELPTDASEALQTIAGHIKHCTQVKTDCERMKVHGLAAFDQRIKDIQEAKVACSLYSAALEGLLQTTGETLALVIGRIDRELLTQAEEFRSLGMYADQKATAQAMFAETRTQIAEKERENVAHESTKEFISAQRGALYNASDTPGELAASPHTTASQIQELDQQEKDVQQQLERVQQELEILHASHASYYADIDQCSRAIAVLEQHIAFASQDILPKLLGLIAPVVSKYEETLGQIEAYVQGAIPTETMIEDVAHQQARLKGDVTLRMPPSSNAAADYMSAENVEQRLTEILSPAAQPVKYKLHLSFLKDPENASKVGAFHATQQELRALIDTYRQILGIDTAQKQYTAREEQEADIEVRSLIEQRTTFDNIATDNIKKIGKATEHFKSAFSDQRSYDEIVAKHEQEAHELANRHSQLEKERGDLETEGSNSLSALARINAELRQIENELEALQARVDEDYQRNHAQTMSLAESGDQQAQEEIERLYDGYLSGPAQHGDPATHPEHERWHKLNARKASVSAQQIEQSAIHERIRESSTTNRNNSSTNTRQMLEEQATFDANQATYLPRIQEFLHDGSFKSNDAENWYKQQIQRFGEIDVEDNQTATPVAERV